MAIASPSPQVTATFSTDIITAGPAALDVGSPLLSSSPPSSVTSMATPVTATTVAQETIAEETITPQDGESQSWEGALQASDTLNPTRVQRYGDDYEFTFNRDGEIAIDLVSQQFDAYLQVIDPLTGVVVAFDDDGGDGLNASLSFQGKTGDQLILRATSYAAHETGSYRLTRSWQDALDQSKGATLPDATTTAELAPSETFLSLTESRPATFSNLRGYGVVNAEAAVAQAQALAIAEPAFPQDTSVQDTSVQDTSAQETSAQDFSPSSANTPALVDEENADVLQARPSSRPPFPNRSFPNYASELLNNSEASLNQIQAPAAWQRGATGAGVVVAVIDSGIDLDHPELQGSIWRNPGEIAGDSIDNDGNGYIDDLHGWNFGMGQNNGDVRPGTDSSYQGHGTHVAGIIAGANDGAGTTGVAYDAKLMMLRLGDATERGTFRNSGNLIDAVYYAVDNGADIINLSLGWSDSPELQAAIAYAAQNNVITVSAAGNSGNQAPPVSPARYADRWGISVGATGRSNDLATFSNQAGDNPDLRHVLAPGRQIFSAHPGNRYLVRSGTSMSAPFVSGVVALMLSANPNLTPTQVRDILIQTAA